jgi:hypothetical protein
VVGAVALAAATALSPPADAASAARIAGLEVRRAGDRVFVSFGVDGAVTEDVVERIHSGIPVTFRHRVELLARRAVPLWPSRVLGRIRVEASVSYDALTRRYELRRQIEVKAGGATDEATGGTGGEVSTESLQDVRAWLTELRDLPGLVLPQGAESERLRVRVESVLGRRYVLYWIPTRVEAAAEQPLRP